MNFNNYSILDTPFFSLGLNNPLNIFGKILLLVVLFCIISCSNAQNTNQEQKKYPRVRKAYAEKETKMLKLFKEKGFPDLQNELFIRAFKKEEILEVWAKNKNTQKFELIITYDFCESSGVLGPKRKEGDRQIPEGVYHISYFNPWSSYHLALKVSYPNASDLILSDKKQPGSDIYIHGACCTIGCIPITDDKIKELYILCVEAKNSGQEKIPIHIFPTKLSDENMKILEYFYSKNVKNIRFWRNLKPIYEFFVNNKQMPKTQVNDKGEYIILP